MELSWLIEHAEFYANGCTKLIERTNQPFLWEIRSIVYQCDSEEDFAEIIRQFEESGATSVCKGVHGGRKMAVFDLFVPIRIGRHMLRRFVLYSQNARTLRPHGIVRINIYPMFVDPCWFAALCESLNRRLGLRFRRQNRKQVFEARHKDFVICVSDSR